MNLKKFISGVSALTIAASAFAGMAVTANAATTAFSQDFTAVEGSTAPADYGFTATGTASVSDGKLTLTSGGNASGDVSSSAVASFTAIPAGNEVTFSCEWETGSATGTRGNSILSLTDGTNAALEIIYYGQDKDLAVNGTVVNGDLARNGKYNVTATLDMNTKKITALSVGNAYTLTSAIDFKSAVTSISAFKFSANAKASWTNTSSIDNVSIAYTEAKLAVNSITVNYTNGGNVIYTDTISKDGKYVGDTMNVPFRKYLLINGTLYEVAKNNSNPYFGQNTTLSLDTVVTKAATVVTPAQGTSYVALYDDGSDGSNSADIRASRMTAKRGDIDLGTVEPGVYSITYNQYIRGGAPALYLDGVLLENVSMKKHEKSWGEETTANIRITKAGNLTIKSVDMTDWVLLIKTDDVATADAVSAPTTFDSEPDTPVKSYTFTATPGTSNGVTQALNSVTVTVKVDGYEDKVQRKTSADFGTISGETTFAVLIGGNVTPTAINVSVD